MTDVVCGKCNNPITQNILTALGKSWHPEHFVCKVCDRPISEGSFNQKDGEPVCSGCYISKYTDVCYACKQHILSQKVIKAMDKTWHEEHFVCGGPCKKALVGASFYERDGQPYCKDCFEAQFASRCAGCSNAILEKAVIALDVKWHKDCFKCQKCKEPISGNTFAVQDNKPLCTECAGI
ncbi:transforming growth factor beta-1-induced transcript 1 protein isoform X1 [Phlebotomus argentipes]|uniref:transforming growth factor beta-1-induced transcript 1 protein isoform X1 n=1 Tax=Phlebotomus argentipes TaxID=94469 RepID=UPI002892AA2A|nr:transforming growth factor beta-1-induced transcript 1 protein isoform X1 [Phlebotomus argentipes]